MLPVNWKGTIVWSGATALATWMASAPPVGAPGGPVRTPAPAARVSPAAVTAPAEVPDLTDEAERLARRLEAQQAYSEPSRDLFQFKAAAPARPRAAVAAVAAVVPAPVVPASVPAAPVFVLVGIAEETSAGVPVRTAVISGAGEVWLVKAGEKVDGRFEVRAVDADAVELIRADTGTALRLSFRP